MSLLLAMKIGSFHLKTKTSITYACDNGALAEEIKEKYSNFFQYSRKGSHKIFVIVDCDSLRFCTLH
jgi:hypothetical protein